MIAVILYEHIISAVLSISRYDHKFRKERKCKRMKRSALAKVLAKLGTSAAKKAAGSASQFGYHQAKEPTNLKKD